MVGLASLVERELRLDPFSGMLFIFRARRADRIKLLVWDGTGLVLVTKRLHDGKFRWPRPGDGVMKLSAAQASALIEGLDWSRVHVPRVPKPLHAQQAARLIARIPVTDVDPRQRASISILAESLHAEPVSRKARSASLLCSPAW